MSESRFSLAFINSQRKIYKRDLWIEKMIRPDKKGEPDIGGSFKSMPFAFEAKLINSKSYTNLHPFGELQREILKIRYHSGVLTGGLLFCEDEIKFLMYYDLKEYIKKEDYDKAITFDFNKLHEYWIANMLPIHIRR